MVEPHVPATCPSLEDLAAFLDARLTGAERERIVTHLASCERCYEVVAEVLHTRSELAADETGGEAAPAAPGTVLPFRRRLQGILKRPFERRSIAAVALPLAAAVTVAVIWRPWAAPPLDLATLTSSLGTAEQAADLAPAIGDHGWSRTRGATPPPTREDEAAFKVGVRSVDLAVSLALGDRQLARGHAAELGRLLEGIDLADSLVGQCRSLFEALPEGDLSELGRDLRRIDEGLELHLSDPRDHRRLLYLRLGKWAQATRLRALTGPPPDPRAARRTIARFRNDGLPEDIEKVLAAADDLLRDGLDPTEAGDLANELAELVESGVQIR